MDLFQLKGEFPKVIISQGLRGRGTHEICEGRMVICFSKLSEALGNLRGYFEEAFGFTLGGGFGNNHGTPRVSKGLSLS